MATEMDDALRTALDCRKIKRGDGSREGLRIYAQARGRRSRKEGVARPAGEAVRRERRKAHENEQRPSSSAPSATV